MRVKTIVAAIAAVAAAACATASVVIETPDAGGEGIDAGGNDGNVNADSGCPQYDLTKDPAHCGTCTHACASGEVCSAGQCKAQCDPPTTKCTGDGGVQRSRAGMAYNRSTAPANADMAAILSCRLRLRGFCLEVYQSGFPTSPGRRKTCRASSTAPPAEPTAHD